MESEDPWTKADAALNQGDNKKALSIAKEFCALQPNYHYAHAVLGSVYVALNDLPNAELAYVRAVELYPAEEHEKALAAVRKRLIKHRGNER